LRRLQSCLHEHAQAFFQGATYRHLTVLNSRDGDDWFLGDLNSVSILMGCPT